MNRMDALDRLTLLSTDMSLEPAEDVRLPSSTRSASRAQAAPVSACGSSRREPFLSEAVMPNGKRITLLKTLLTSACERNCFYCPFRAGRDFRRTTLKPDEMASLFINLHRAGIAQGIFLSSGIVAGGVRTQDQLLATAEILRLKRGYQGYIHLKLMPGAEKAQVEQAMRLADRVSVNLEAPNTARLEQLAPRKAFLDELLQPLRWVDEIRKMSSPHNAWKGTWPSSVTQFVVGAVGESDLELLNATRYLYSRLHLRRTYFSAFRPIPDTPFENLDPETPEREHRLYQASFLLRDYGFDLEDLPFSPSGQLPRHTDPKTAWAQAHLQESPVELNMADRAALLRVPGIGPRSADAILSARRRGRLKDITDLRKIGVEASRLVPFVLLDGRRPPRQLSFDFTL
jgi:predicted DNA-binding helix-hairpin-helix protein